MKAPDKIYINGFSAFATEPVKEGIDYIRKDALLEYAKARLLQYDPDYSSAGRELQMIIDRLNEM